MKADIHPDYQYILVRDVSSGFEFVTRSSAPPSTFRKSEVFEGEEYPLLVVDISSKSHPFYTGTQRIMDIEGRVQAYYRKYGLVNPNEDEEAAAAAAAETSEAEGAEAAAE